MNYDELTDEQKAAARACKTPEELLALAKQEGYEISDEDLEAVAGGGWMTEELDGVSTTYKECSSLSCGEFGCTKVICPDFTCKTYENR